MVTHSGILACKIPWTEAPSGLQSMGLREWDMSERSTRTPVLGSSNLLGTHAQHGRRT